MKVLFRNIAKYIAPTFLGFISINSYRRTLNQEGLITCKTLVEKEENLRQAALYKKNFEDEVKLRLEQNTKFEGVQAPIKEDFISKEQLEEQLKNSSGEGKVALEKLLESVNSNIDTNIDNLGKSNFFSFLEVFIKKYSEFLEGLTSNQILALFNIIIDCTITISFFSIITILTSDHIINYFNLEKRYPKLANFIKLKKVINYHLKIYHIVFFLLFLLFGIGGNIYMLFLTF